MFIDGLCSKSIISARQDIVRSIRSDVEAMCDAGRQIRTEDFDLTQLPEMFQVLLVTNSSVLWMMV